jgi:hypothetical protein
MKFTDLLKEDTDPDALILALKMVGYEVNVHGEIEWRGLAMIDVNERRNKK